MHFAFFLKNKREITESQLLELLSEQQKTGPTLIEVLTDLLGAPKMFEVLGECYEKNLSLFELQSQKKCISEEIFNKALHIGNAQKTPLSRLLVQNSIMPEEKVHELLNEFSQATSSNAPSEEGVVTEEIEDDSVINDAALESLRELLGDDAVTEALESSAPEDVAEENALIPEELDENYIEKFFELVTPDTIRELNGMITELEEVDGNKFKPIQENFYAEAYKIKNAAVLLNAKLLESLIVEVMSHIDDAGESKADTGMLREGLKLIMAFVKIIGAKRTEEAVSEIPEVFEKYQRYIS